MNWTPQTLGSFEKIWAQFYIGRNEWYELDWSTGGSVTQLRGFGMFVATRQYLIDTFQAFIANGYISSRLTGVKPADPQRGNVLGKAVHCLSLTYGIDVIASSSFGAGVVDDDIRCGREPGAGRWVLVQQYGLHDAVAFTGPLPDGGAMYIGSSTGLLGTIPKEALSTYPKLRGLASIDTAAAGPLTLNLDGTNTTGVTWFSPPSVFPEATIPADGSTITNQGQKVLPHFQLAGWKPSEAASVIGGPKYPDNVNRGRAFLCTLQTNVGH